MYGLDDCLTKRCKVLLDDIHLPIHVRALLRVAQINARPVLPYAMGLFWIVFDVIALQLNKLVEAEFTQRLSFSRVFPSYPSKILLCSVQILDLVNAYLRAQGSHSDSRKRYPPQRLR